MFAICVKTGLFRMKNTLFFHVWAPNIYGTSLAIYLIIFLAVISNVLYFNITHSLVQLPIFLIDFCWDL